jgi:hypothetical protein
MYRIQNVLELCVCQNGCFLPFSVNQYTIQPFLAQPFMEGGFLIFILCARHLWHLFFKMVRIVEEIHTALLFRSSMNFSLNGFTDMYVFKFHIFNWNSAKHNYRNFFSPSLARWHSTQWNKPLDWRRNAEDMHMVDIS